MKKIIFFFFALISHNNDILINVRKNDHHILIRHSDISKNFVAKFMMTMILEQQKQWNSDDFIDDKTFYDFFDKLPYEGRKGILDGIKSYIIFEKEFLNLYQNKSGDLLFSIIYNQLFLELKQNVIFQDLIKSNKKINDEYISKNLNAFLSHYFTNENAQYLYEYKIYRFKDKKLYNNQYNLSKHNDLLDLNFVICKLLDYSSINLSKDFFNKQFVDMIENKQNLIFVEFNNESYLLEIKNPNTKSKNNIDTIRSIKSKELFNVINTKNREDFMVDLKTKYFKLIDNKKEFVLNNKIYNIDNILDINLIKMVLFGTLTKQNSNPNYNVSDKKLKSLVQSMSLDDFKSFITNPHVLDVILLNEYFEEHKTTLIENNKMLWYKEYYSRIMQLVSAYYMQKDQSQIDQLINEETNKQIENLYKDNKNKLYYKIRYFEFNHEMEASDFYNDLLDNKKINLDYYTYQDISDMMFLPFIDYSKLENMSFKYKIASKIQDAIKSKINYNQKQIPYNDLLELNDKFYIFQIYDIATVEDLDNLFNFLKEYNKYIISAKTNEQMATKIIQSYKE